MNFRTLYYLFKFDPNFKRVDQTKDKYFYINYENRKFQTTRGNCQIQTIAKYAKKYNFSNISQYEFYSLIDGSILDDTQKHFNIPKVYIHSSFSIIDYKEPTLEFTIYLSNQKRYNIKTLSNLDITPENIKKLVFEYINKNILYAPGLFRNLQLTFGLDKDATKIKYKSIIKHIKEKSFFDVENYIYKKFNIVFDSTRINVNNVLKYAKSLNVKPKETIYINSINDLILDLTNLEFDDIENEFYNELNKAVYL